MCRLICGRFAKAAFFLSTLLLSMMFMSSTVLGRDADGAKKDIDSAKSNISNNDLDKATTDLQLGEAELDGITDASVKADLTKQIADLKKQIADTKGSAANADLIKSLDFHLKNLKDYLDDHDGFQRELKETQDQLSADDTKKALGDDKIASYQKQIGVLAKVEKSKHADKAHTDIENQLKDGETRLVDWQKVMADPNGSQSDRDTGAMAIAGVVKNVRAIVADLPSDDSRSPDYLARAKKLDDAVNAAGNAAAQSELLDRLKREWDGMKDEYTGWEAETTGATFDQITHQQSDAMSKLNAPKSVALVSKSSQLLDDAANLTKETPADAKIGAFIDSVKQQRATAHTKLAKFADAILSDAEKVAALTKDQADRLDSFAKYDLRDALHGYDQIAAYQSRATKLVDKFNNASNANAAANDAALKQMTAAATAAWPGIAAKFSPVDGFDPTKLDSFKGKTIQFKNVNNRLGWDYAPGDFDFATSVNGMPIAGKFVPAITAAIKDARAKTGLVDFPDEGWDVIAVVEGTGQLSERTSADIKTTGGETVAKAEGHRRIDCAVVRIVALHAGPVAVMEGGSSSSGGSGDAAEAGMGGGGGSSHGGVFHYLACLIGLGGAGFAFVRARPQLVPALGAMNATNQNTLDLAGVAFAVVGVLWLLKGLIYKDLLPATALIACGVYASSGLLVAKGILPPAMAEKLKPFGLPIAVGAAVIILIHMKVDGGFLI